MSIRSIQHLCCNWSYTKPPVFSICMRKLHERFGYVFMKVIIVKFVDHWWVPKTMQKENMCTICTRVYIWPCERCFKNLQPGAYCAHERKTFNFYTFWSEIGYFLLRSCINRLKIDFKLHFNKWNMAYQTSQIIEITILDILLQGVCICMGTVDRPLAPHIFGIQTPGVVARLVAWPFCMRTVAR